MTPTPEQLEAVAKAGDQAYADYCNAAHLGTPPDQRYRFVLARRMWDVIAPIVRAQALEEAAVLVEEWRGEPFAIDVAAGVRALKDKP